MPSSLERASAGRLLGKHGSEKKKKKQMVPSGTTPFSKANARGLGSRVPGSDREIARALVDTCVGRKEQTRELICANGVIHIILSK